MLEDTPQLPLQARSEGAELDIETRSSSEEETVRKASFLAGL